MSFISQEDNEVVMEIEIFEEHKAAEWIRMTQDMLFSKKEI